MTPLRYVLYARKSSEDEGRQVLSIESQERKGHEMFPGLRIVKVVPESRSAFTPNNRPKFEAEVLGYIEAGHADGILAWHPDRLSRNEIDAAKITYMIRRGVIKDLKFCSYHFDNSPEGIMMLQLALSQSQYFSSKLSKDVKRGNETKLRLGWRPGVVPQGYLNERVHHTVVNDPDRFDIVRRMWDYLLTGQYSPPRIWEIATTEWGFTTVKRGKTGGKPLARSAIYRIFINPFYAGFIRHNGQLHKGSHQPMVTIEEFRTAQAILARTKRSRQRKTVRYQFTYSGLITCRECGCLYTAEAHKGHVYYHCTRKKRTIACSQRTSIREDRLDNQFTRVMQQRTIHPTFRQWAHNYLDRIAENEAKTAATIQTSRERKISALRSQLNGLIDMRATNLIDDEDFIHRRNTLKLDIANLEEQLVRADDQAKEVRDQTKRVFDLLTYGQAVLRHGSIRKKQAVIHGLTKQRTAANGQLHAELHDWIVPITRAYQRLRPSYRRQGWRPSCTANTPVTPSNPLPYPSTAYRCVRTATASQYGPTTEVKNKRAANMAAVMSLWLATVDEVRTIVRERLAEVRLPKFDALGDVILDDHGSSAQSDSNQAERGA